MRYVEFTDSNNKSLGRIYLDEEGKKSKIKYGEDLDEYIIESLETFGVIEVEENSNRQMFPDGSDPLLFLKNLKFEFSGSSIRASDVKEEK
jgi:hypothetical protein